MRVATRCLDHVELADRLAAEISFASRHGTAIGVLLVYAEDGRAGELLERLSGMLRAEDVLARCDERSLCIVVRGIAPPAMRQMAERLCALLAHRPSRPLPGQARGVSIGLAIGEPLRVDESAESLLARARVALDRARADGGGRVKA
jgi:GGDEF domain-containing protein